MEKQEVSNKKADVFHTSLFMLALILLAAGLMLSVMTAITFGNADISLKDVYGVVGCEMLKMKRFSEFSEGSVHDVVWLIRFPRVMLALAVGMGLSVCGVVMQAIVKNPLADPYILGVSSGAALGATFAIMLGVGSFLGGNFVGIMAFVGAMITSFMVMAIANMGGRANAGKLILAGTAVSSVCSAFSSFIIFIVNDNNATAEVMRWTMGSLSGADWARAAVILPVVLVCTLIFWTQYRSLHLMLLGDEVSITRGTNLHKNRTVYLIRILFGTDHKRLIPLSALLGSIFLIWADVASRIILKNAEMPIGILVSLIGAPCFIYLLVKRSYGFGGGRS